VEDSFVVMRDRAGLTVHQVRSTNHFPSESRANGLMSQANPKDRNSACEVADQIDADASVLRRAWTGRDDDSFRVHRIDVGNRDLIVAAHFDLSPEFPEILNQVVSERIVIVENEDH